MSIITRPGTRTPWQASELVDTLLTVEAGNVVRHWISRAYYPSSGAAE